MVRSAIPRASSWSAPLAMRASRHRDRQEPPGKALGAGAGVPEVLDGGVVGVADDDGARLACLQGPGPDPALYGVDLVDDVDHDANPFPHRGGARACPGPVRSP